jgi:hypothetical protein
MIDGVGDGGRNSDNSNLAHAFDSHRVDLAARLFDEDNLDVVHVGMHRHMVLGNVRVHHAAEVVVDQRPCARAASGQAAAEPATTLMKSRRRTQPSPAKSRTTLVFEAYQIKAAMFALGHKRTFALQKLMSALPPKADIGRIHLLGERYCP